MKKIRLNLEQLRVDTFATEKRGGVSAQSGYTHYEGGCTTHSLDYATHCDCSGGPRCTLECVEYSQATDLQICCG